MGALVDLTGQIFGRLTVLRRSPEDPFDDRRQKSARWRCKCECGNETDVFSINLRSGDTKSCGCLREEARARTRARRPIQLGTPKNRGKRGDRT